MKKGFLIVLAVLLLVGLLFFLSLGGLRTDVFVHELGLSQDGGTLSFKAGVASSMGYVRSCRARQDGDGLYLSFYSTFGLNNPLGARSAFEVELTGDCNKVYVNRGAFEYELVYEKNSENDEWQRVTQ